MQDAAPVGMADGAGNRRDQSGRGPLIGREVR